MRSPKPRATRKLADFTRFYTKLVSDPELVVHRTEAMTEVVGRGTSRERFALILMGSFAAVSLALAALGLYGVLAYSVRQRTREIGVRIALGATAAQIRQLVLRQTTLFLSAELVAGICGSLALGGFLKSLVFGISPTDPRILAVAAISLIATALLAAWLPMRRAARMDPMVALRGE